MRCISFDSYIKPQLFSSFVLLLIGCISFDSYIKPQRFRPSANVIMVVYLLIPTSNHNWINTYITFGLLYIFWFLHQTTTFVLNKDVPIGCISFDSYIKPQPCILRIWRGKVVYLLIPTSNHNLSHALWFYAMLYIFWFLHQTTTDYGNSAAVLRCISFDSYIKPQQSTCRAPERLVVYLLIPTSNHNYFEFVFRNYLLYIFWFLHQTTTSNPTVNNLL